MKHFEFEEKKLKKLHKSFCDMDDDDSGQVSLEEFLKYYNIEETPFAKRAFSLLDDDGSGELDFGEFVVAIFNFATSTQFLLVSFLFDLFDLDGGGTLDMPECEALMRMMYNVEEINMEVVQALDRIDQDGDGDVTIEELVDFGKTEPCLLAPVLALQKTLRKRIFGLKFWRLKTEWRIKTWGATRSIISIMAEKDEQIAAVVAKREAELEARRLEKERIKEERRKERERLRAAQKEAKRQEALERKRMEEGDQEVACDEAICQHVLTLVLSVVETLVMHATSLSRVC